MAKKKYHTEEERKAAKKARTREYNAARSADPEFRAKRREYDAARRSTPEYKAKRREDFRAYGKTTDGLRILTKHAWKKQGIKFASELDQQIWLALSVYDGTVCAVTGMTNAEHKAKFGSRLVLDHDHSTGEPRRFLCDHINVSLGRLERLSLTDEQLNNLISLIKEDRR